MKRKVSFWIEEGKTEKDLLGEETVLDLVSFVLGLILGMASGLGLAYFRQKNLVSSLREKEIALARFEERASQWEEERSRFREIQKDLEKNFETLARKLLELAQQTTESSRREHEETLTRLVSPLAQTLERLNEEVHRLEKEREGAYQRLEEQLRALVSDHLPRLEEETRRLSQALADPGVRGRWGEIQLRRLIEWTGLLPHCHFGEQIRLEDGRRPDLVVKLPGGRVLAIDAKAPLKPFLKGLETKDFSAYLKALRQEIKTLSSRKYWSALNQALGRSPEFVVLFLPAEPLLNTALREDPELFEMAIKQKVILASPLTLVAILKAIALLLREEALLQNAEEIARLGQELYERLAKMASYLSDLGRSLTKTVEHYDRLVGSFEARVLVSAQKFKDLGVAGGEKLPSPSALGRKPRHLQG